MPSLTIDFGRILDRKKSVWWQYENENGLIEAGT